jgi:CxxC motif-containing protein (DUF1111 family)
MRERDDTVGHSFISLPENSCGTTFSIGLSSNDRGQTLLIRTAPLWGVGQRIFFLHDGRTSDLMQAIQSHVSKAGLVYPASEANTVINNFNALPASSQQDVLNFLRSL